MLSGVSREAAGGRRARVPCRFCSVPIELSRMRAHLRQEHQLGSAELETTFLEARKTARRSIRMVVRR